MIHLEPTKDWNYIKSVATHPRLWPYLADDFSPAPEVWEPPDSESRIYLKVADQERELGFFLLCAFSPILFQVHTALLPCAWGKRAAAAAEALIAWVWEHTTCQRLITEVPDYNTLAHRFALKAGMTEYGRNPKSFSKDGLLHDLILLGISKE